MTETDWTSEFAKLGPSRVRAALGEAVWSVGKCNAARKWLEAVDAERWQSEHESDEAYRPPVLVRMRKVHWIVLMGGILVLTLFVIQMLSR